jgi:hypothetical protein
VANLGSGNNIGNPCWLTSAATNDLNTPISLYGLSVGNTSNSHNWAIVLKTPLLITNDETHTMVPPLTVSGGTLILNGCTLKLSGGKASNGADSVFSGGKIAGIQSTDNLTLSNADFTVKDDAAELDLNTNVGATSIMRLISMNNNLEFGDTGTVYQKTPQIVVDATGAELHFSQDITSSLDLYNEGGLVVPTDRDFDTSTIWAEGNGAIFRDGLATTGVDNKVQVQGWIDLGANSTDKGILKIGDAANDDNWLDINGKSGSGSGNPNQSLWQEGSGSLTQVYGGAELVCDANGGGMEVDGGTLEVQAGSNVPTRGYLVIGNLNDALVFGSVNAQTFLIDSSGTDGGYARIDGSITMTSKTTLKESGDPGGNLGYIKDNYGSGASVIAIGSATLSITDAVGAAIKNGFTPFSITTTATTGITGSFGSLSDTAGKTLTNPAGPTNGGGTWTYPITVT